MIIKKLNTRQIRWTKKLIAIDFNIEYRKNKLNSTNASLKRLDFMKSNNSENNDDDFLFILRYKLRSREYQFEFQENYNVSIIIKLAALNWYSKKIFEESHIYNLIRLREWWEKEIENDSLTSYHRRRCENATRSTRSRRTMQIWLRWRRSAATTIKQWKSYVRRLY